MTKWIAVAEAKSHFSALLAAVARDGEHFVIERRGKPVAALVSVDDLERIESKPASGDTPKGFLALVGLFGDLYDSEIDTMIEEIYAARERDVPRPVDLSLDVSP